MATSTSPALAGHVTIVDDPEVDPTAVETVHQAVENTLDLFREEFGLTLDHDVKLILTADKGDYAEAFGRRNGQTRDAAAHWADKSIGLSARGMIVEDLGRQKSVTEKVFVAAHELTHQFQDQASKGHHGPIVWISEGVADCIAAKVVEQSRLGSIAAYRNIWGKQLNSVTERPRLAALHGRANWAAAENRYGGNIIYRIADLAVLQLIELRGERALFEYFHRLQHMEFEQAFRETFGLDLNRFELQTEQ